MDVMRALKETVKLAAERGMPDAAPDGLGYPHIAGMVIRIQDKADIGTPFSYGKLCRWLGWMQCAVVASGVATLDDMKAINQLCK